MHTQLRDIIVVSTTKKSSCFIKTHSARLFSHLILPSHFYAFLQFFCPKLQRVWYLGFSFNESTYIFTMVAKIDKQKSKESTK